MKHPVLTVLLAVFAFLAALPSVRADIWGVNYSGRLLGVENGKAAPPANADKETSFAVKVYDESSGSTTNWIWRRETRAYVLDGWFTLELTGLENALPLASGSDLKLGITPENGAEIEPRQSFAAVPTAYCAYDALGANRGLTVAGTLAAASLNAENVTYGSSATHAGRTVFTKKLSLPELRSANGTELTVGALSVREPVKLDTLTARTLSASNGAELTVASVGALTAQEIRATNETVRIVRLEGAGGEAKPGDLAVAGDYTHEVGALAVKDLRLRPDRPLVNWVGGIVRLLPNDESTSYGYQKLSGGGRWVVTEDCFLSISPLSSNSVSGVTITITPKEGDEVSYVQSASGGVVAMPLQMFVREGDTVSWSDASPEDSLDHFAPYLTYRRFTY